MNEFFAETLTIVKILINGFWIGVFAIFFIIAPISVISDDWDFFKKSETCRIAEWNIENSLYQIESVKDYIRLLRGRFDTMYTDLELDFAQAYNRLREGQATLKEVKADVKRVCYDTPDSRYIGDYNVFTYYTAPFYLNKLFLVIRYPLQ